MTDNLIHNLIDYAERELELDPRDRTVAVNGLLEIFGIAEPTLLSPKHLSTDEVMSLLPDDEMLDKVMGALSLKPSEVNSKFQALLKNGGKKATDWLYSYCVKNGYVKRALLNKNPRFNVGNITVTINKAKPEFKDPKKAAAQSSTNYPKCVICRENEGYAPRNKRALRTVDINLGGEQFFWQYSPYGYFNEHGIAVNTVHTPMYVDKTTFGKLMDFVDIFPHYFIGCNAALPRIGGSVLAHDHYQGGGEVLPLHKAGIKTHYKDKEYPDVEIGTIDWHGNVIRVVGKRDDVTAIAEKIRKAWVEYNNPTLGIIAKDNDGIHNAISPTVRKKGDKYSMDMILRSNITSKEYPDGVFHAHPEFYCIKKESIGLIEAQGLFILPGRLEKQLADVEECVKTGKLKDELKEFELVYDEVKAMNMPDAHEAMKRELGSVCQRILENTAVFKTVEQFDAFMKGIGFTDA